MVISKKTMISHSPDWVKLFSMEGSKLLFSMETYRDFQGRWSRPPYPLSVSTHAESVYGRKMKENYICSVHYTLGDILNMVIFCMTGDSDVEFDFKKRIWEE